MAGTLRVEIWVNGVLVDYKLGASPVSYSTATMLLGEGDGSHSLPAVNVRYDDASLMEGSTEKLGNRSFESSFNSTGLSASYGNWRPSRDMTRASDIVRTGNYSASINRPATSSSASFLIQDASLSANTTLDISCWIYKSSSASTGRNQMQVMFDWDRGGGSASGVVAMQQLADGTVSWLGYDVGRSGLTGLLPTNTWTHWRIRVYPSYVRRPRAHLGLVVHTGP